MDKEEWEAARNRLITKLEKVLYLLDGTECNQGIMVNSHGQGMIREALDMAYDFAENVEYEVIAEDVQHGGLMKWLDNGERLMLAALENISDDLEHSGEVKTYQQSLVSIRKLKSSLKELGYE